MEYPVTLWFSEEEYAGLLAQAGRHQKTPDERAWAWVRPSLDEAVKDWRARQWDQRRRKLAADEALAATVDAATETP